MKKILLIIFCLMFASTGLAGDLSGTKANLKILLDNLDPNADGNPSVGDLA